MFSSESKVKVRYGETDQMGIVYHGNYALYYEIARTDCFELASGLTYASMEADGVMLPILSLESKFIKPAYYNEILTIKAIVKTLPTVKLHVDYEVYNEKEELINIGKTTLVFVDKESRRPCHPPEKFMKKIRTYFDEK